MLDFLNISYRSTKRGNIEIFPKFRVDRNKDLMVRGGDFHAIWVADKGLWSTSEFDAIRMIDHEMDLYFEENKSKFDSNTKIMYMWDSDTGTIDRFHKYCQRQLRDNYHPLDENITFLDQETTRESYASKRLPYPLVKMETPAWDKLVDTLYDPEERAKIEWAIGSIVAGESVDLQKFFVFYGSGGTGKSTIMNIIEDLFEGYTATFSAANLGNSNSAFALEPFTTNPLVAIDQDGDLSKINDNTRLNSLVSHDKLTINEKFKSTYTNKFRCVLFIGTNTPVKITDAKSGLIRRLVDIEPSGRLLNKSDYDQCTTQVRYELGGIAMKCRDRYISNPRFYDGYTPRRMIVATNDFYNYITDIYLEFQEQDKVQLNVAWQQYKKYCEDANVSRTFSKTRFREEMEQYFENCYLHDPDDISLGVTYVGFKKMKFAQLSSSLIVPEEPKEVRDLWLTFLEQPSYFEKEFPNAMAQYEIEDDTGKTTLQGSWDKCKTSLKDIDTSKVHYVRVPLNHIVVDFDIPDETGKKCFELNRKAALKFPPTYAELSKSGEGIHLHYYYKGDPTELLRNIDDHIEIKVFTGKMSLRRKFTKCNNVPILTITGGLPVKKKEMVDKMINKNVVLSERTIRKTIENILQKNYSKIGGTKPGMDHIKHILDEQYEAGSHYDLSQMKPAVIKFAMQSTNHPQYCLELIDQIKWESDEPSNTIADEENKPIVFYDIEVFPNLFVICWKSEGLGKPVNIMINPSPEEVREIFDFKLVGFNNRNYDNHIIYARGQDYSIPMLYTLSKKIISGDDRNAKFREAYNLSFTDIYDFASAGNKKGLKKLEIEMNNLSVDELKEMGYSDERIALIKAGGHHQELGLDWDQPVPEELWNKVAEYCVNDVIATEGAFNFLNADFAARQALADISESDVNQTTNTLSQAFIFLDDKNPQAEFCYRDMAKPVKSLNSKVTDFLIETCPVMMSATHGEANSILPYFPGYVMENGKSTYMDCIAGEGGYVYSEPGMHQWIALLDVASMHPHSTIAECLFGPRYTRRFAEIVEARVYIKHEEWDMVAQMLDGKLVPYIEKIKNGEMKASDLANALKTVINSVYGLTAASFANRFRDERNKDNIVAKRGALFMIELQHKVQELGYQVAHIKTDSIKIPNAEQDIISFVMDFGKRYGYTFELEAIYDRMVLVNKAVYIAKYATPEDCYECFGIVPKDNKKKGGKWTATGDEFRVPYIFKRLFTKEPIEFKDMCRTFQVKKGDLNLDFNEGLPDISAEEKEFKKLEAKYKKGELSDTTFETECQKLKEVIDTGHSYQYVGRVGEFVPVKENTGGGVLYRKEGEKAYAASGSTGYRWKEAEVVKANGLEDTVDREYWESQVADAIKHISDFCDFEWFIA